MECVKKVQWKYLPEDIWSEIFVSYCTFEDLENSRFLQSEYVKECTKWCEEYECAVEENNLKNLKWMHQYSLNTDGYSIEMQEEDDITGDLLSKAAEGGHWEVVKWLRQVGCAWSKSTFVKFARGGDLETMKYLKANGCPWNGRTFLATARRGDLETMKWLLANGCPWNGDTFLATADRGDLATMKWLKEKIVHGMVIPSSQLLGAETLKLWCGYKPMGVQ